MSFTSFIKKQVIRDDPVGDFARDFVYIHSVFLQNQVIREWFKVDQKEIEKAIYVYV